LLFVIGPVPTIVSSRRETVLSLTIHFSLVLHSLLRSIMYTDSVELVQGQTLANKVRIQFLVREELMLLPINRKNEDV
jgi:hypothetical protein